MNRPMRSLHLLLLALLAPVAAAQGLRLTTQIPDCRLPAKPFPEKYEKLARTNKVYAWIRKAPPADAVVSGKSGERADGSEMYVWLTFYRADLDNDGECDWYLNAATPLSTGGDRNSINTIYLGSKRGWIRVGAPVPADKPDELGFGKTEAEQARYLFGEDISVIHDAASNTNYFITAFYSRHVSYYAMPGYRIMVWDANRRNLRLLDKWEPASRAAEVYAFFREHGARRPAMKAEKPGDTLERFDPETEAYELSKACESTETGALSRHLLAHCKR
jgi:hypothetical protein